MQGGTVPCTSDSGFPWITDDLPPVFANGNPAEIYRQSMRGLTRVGVVIIRCSMTKLRYLQVFDLIWTELPTCNVCVKLVVTAA